jgi:hypothetical protein
MRLGVAWQGMGSLGARMNAVAKVVELSTATNGGKKAISASEPYSVLVTIQGSADLLFHRWNCEAVDEKAKAAKNSKAKKTDDVESYVYRDAEGVLCLPGEYLRQAIITAAKFKQDRAHHASRLWTCSRRESLAKRCSRHSASRIGITSMCVA